jgi:hypothetical protein
MELHVRMSVSHVRHYNSDINITDNKNPISLISIITTYHWKTILSDALCNTNVSVKFSSTEIMSLYF